MALKLSDEEVEEGEARKASWAQNLAGIVARNGDENKFTCDCSKYHIALLSQR